MFSWWRKREYRQRIAEEDAAVLIARHGVRASGEIVVVEKVLEKLGTTESTTIAVSRKTDGKNPNRIVALGSPKVILRGEVLEVRNVGGSLHIARKVKSPDEWDPPTALWAGHRRNDKVIEA
jgi:hypothetical protein